MKKYHDLLKPGVMVRRRKSVWGTAPAPILMLARRMSNPKSGLRGQHGRWWVAIDLLARKEHQVLLYPTLWEVLDDTQD